MHQPDDTVVGYIELIRSHIYRYYHRYQQMRSERARDALLLKQSDMATLMGKRGLSYTLTSTTRDRHLLNGELVAAILDPLPYSEILEESLRADGFIFMDCIGEEALPPYDIGFFKYTDPRRRALFDSMQGATVIVGYTEEAIRLIPNTDPMQGLEIERKLGLASLCVRSNARVLTKRQAADSAASQLGLEPEIVAELEMIGIDDVDGLIMEMAEMSEEEQNDKIEELIEALQQVEV